MGCVLILLYPWLKYHALGDVDIFLTYSLLPILGTSYVVTGVFLGALGVYKPLTQFAGCGATVPLSGFGYTLSEGVKKAVNERGILGVFTGGLASTAAGITAAMIAGLIMSIIFRAKDKC